MSSRLHPALAMSWSDVRADLLAAACEGADDAASCYVLYESMEALERMYGLSQEHFFLQALGYVARRVYEAGLRMLEGRWLSRPWIHLISLGRYRSPTCGGRCRCCEGSGIGRYM